MKLFKIFLLIFLGWCFFARIKDVDSLNSYDRQKAVDYAYKWSKNWDKLRNPDFPSFDLDCTNFVSQSILAGGINMQGSGGCKYENFGNNWYVGKSSWYCFSPWAWSNSWSSVFDFWNYHKKNGAISKEFSSLNLDDLRKEAQIGDVLQYRLESQGEKTHSMIITKKDDKDIYLTYHTNGQGLDRVDVSLEEINLNTEILIFYLIKF